MTLSLIKNSMIQFSHLNIKLILVIVTQFSRFFPALDNF